MKTYILIIEGDADSGYSAYFPDVLGCVTAGDSLDEIRRLAVEVIEFHLEGEAAPPARSLAEILADPEVATALDGTELFAPVVYHAEHFAEV